MKRFARFLVVPGLILNVFLQAGLFVQGYVHGEESKVKVLGEGPAYEQVGKLAVMHVGRVKPLDTLAREEVSTFGRETIKLHDATGAVVETWGPVGAFFDWMVRPEFWDDQPFVLVDYLPLRQVILADSTRSRLKDLASHESTSADDRAAPRGCWKARSSPPRRSRPTSRVASFLKPIARLSLNSPSGWARSTNG